MAKLVIKKRVNLDFLGEEYKDAELVFRSIPLIDYEILMEELPKSNIRLKELREKQKQDHLSTEDKSEFDELILQDAEQNKKSFKTILEYLKRYFLSGKFPDDEDNIQSIESVDLDGLDRDTAIKCFNILTGQETDPKS